MQKSVQGFEGNERFSQGQASHFLKSRFLINL